MPNLPNTGTHGTGSRSFTRDRGVAQPGGSAGPAIDVRDYAASGDGSTDDTVAVQAALTAAAAAGVPCWLPAGVYVTSGLTWPTGLPALFGDGNDVSILKRKSAAVSSASILAATSQSDFTISDIGLDGNKANQTLGGNSLTLSGCSDFQLRRLRSFGAKAASGYGDGFTLSLTPATNPAGREAALKDCEAYDNDGNGLDILRTGAALSIDGGDYSDNGGSGIYFYDQAITPAAGTVPNMRIANLRAERNTGAGITVLGFTVAGIASVRTFGHGADPVHGLIVTGCQANENDGYGIFVQATGAAVIGNTTRGNGSSTHAGICANAEHISIIGNIASDNVYWGIDAGGCRYFTIAHNQLSGNSGVGINLGACQHGSCSDNMLANAGGTAIALSRNDAGTYWFPWDAIDVDICRNKIIETRSTSNFGIQCTGLPDDIRIIENSFVWPDTTAYNAIRAGLTTGIIRGNRLVGNTSDSFVMNSAATITWPEWADALAFNTDTAAITALRTQSQLIGNGTLTAAKMTNRGTGYTADFAVAVTGGGGAGATAMARVTTDGRVAAVQITAAGSGYSSTPTLDFSAGSGSGAAGTAVINVPLSNGKVLTLLGHGSAFRVTDGATIQTPSPAGATITVASQGSLTLRSVQDVWYPVAFAAPLGTLYPTVVNIGGTTHTAGTGTPEGVVTAPVGSTFRRTDGGAGTSFYVKESGAGNTGWVGK